MTLASSLSGATFADLQQYIQRLLVSLPDQESGNTGIKSPLGSIPAVSNIRKNGDAVEYDLQQARAIEEVRRREKEREREDEGGLTGCREAVEILTRNPKKGMLP